MDVAERTFWTCCAFDAIGILAAIELDGTIRTSKPETGAPFEIAFDRGQPALSSAYCSCRPWAQIRART